MNVRLVWSLRVGWSLVATALSALPLVALFRHPELPASFAVLIAGLAGLALWRPAFALVAACVMLPFVHGLQILLAPPIGGAEITECFAAAFLCGAAPRVMAPGWPRDDRLGRPALILGAIVAASAVVDLAGRMTFGPGQTPLFDVWHHLTTASYFSPGPFFELHQAIRWIETLAVAVFVERIMRASPSSQVLAVRVWLAAGAGAASFALIRLIEVSLRSPTPFDALARFARTLRISVFLPDPNAAGSLFVLFAVPALVIGIARRSPWLLGVIAPISLAALWLTKSRAAVIAVAIVLGVWLFSRMLRAKHYAPAAVVVAAAIAFGAYMWTRHTSTNSSIEEALFIRGELGKVALDIAGKAPVWGTGIGRFLTESRTYIEPGLIAMFPQAARGENAHNNYLQVLAELGIAGFAAFTWLTLASVWPSGRGAPASPERLGMTAGVATFLLSALLGHPLLLTQVAFAALFAMGLSAGLRPAVVPGRTVTIAQVICCLAIVTTVASLWWRVRPAEEPLISGAGEVAGEIDAMAYRRAESHSTWLLPITSRVVVAPLRWDAGSATDCQVEIALDGVVANRVTPAADQWLPVRFALPSPERGLHARRLELRVSDARCRLIVGTIDAQ